jgi:hypothetical protein
MESSSEEEFFMTYIEAIVQVAKLSRKLHGGLENTMFSKD